MEVVIDYEYLIWEKGEIIIKEVSVAEKDVFHTFHFRNSYPMIPHGLEEIGPNLDDSIVPYKLLETALS